MTRRIPQNKTGLIGTGKVNYQKIYRVFDCLNPECEYFFIIEEDSISLDNLDDVKFTCPNCSFKHDISIDASYQNGYFAKFLEKTPHWKYCRICENLKPVNVFDKHARMPSGYQMECKVCKWVINARLNPKRTRDQLREGSEGRRLLEVFRGEEKFKLDEKALLKDFGNVCFKCKKDLSSASRSDYHVDHVLPAKYLWRLEDAMTPLCKKCNLEKRDSWPSIFYTKTQLKDLSLRTGVPFEILSSKQPKINPTALEKIEGKADEIYRELASRPREMKRLRNIILATENIDILDYLQEYSKEKILKIINNLD